MGKTSYVGGLFSCQRKNLRKEVFCWRRIMKEKVDYELLRCGGRVKSAGLPVDFVFEQGERFRTDPGPESAAQATRTFSVLRDNPPSEIRNRFFPLDRGGVKAQTKGSPALYRPVLKNDQGAREILTFYSWREYLGF